MPHVLVLNPNTREALTGQLVQQVQTLWDAAGAGDATAPSPPPVHGLTAPHGADYIASEATYVVAARAALDAWYLHEAHQAPSGAPPHAAQGRPLALLVACFGDPGVWALREVTGLPVTGLAEAAMREAQALGPFGIVTGGQAWGAMLMRLARGLQCAGPQGLVAVQTVEASGGEMAAQPEAAWDALAQACVELLQAHPALRSIILGGAALGGWVPPVLARLQARCAQGDIAQVPPLIDSVEAGARWLRQAAGA
jgi:allantoin racemase